MNKETTLISLNYPKLHLVKEIPIHIEPFEHHNGWIAACPMFNHEWGSSIENEQIAVKILSANLVELYYFLKQNQNNLGPHMQNIWNEMQNYIKET